MMQTLDQRLQKAVKEICKNNGLDYSHELFLKLTEDVVVGYSPENTWDNAVKKMNKKLQEICEVQVA